MKLVLAILIFASSVIAKSAKPTIHPGEKSAKYEIVQFDYDFVISNGGTIKTSRIFRINFETGRTEILFHYLLKDGTTRIFWQPIYEWEEEIDRQSGEIFGNKKENREP